MVDFKAMVLLLQNMLKIPVGFGDDSPEDTNTREAKNLAPAECTNVEHGLGGLGIIGAIKIIWRRNSQTVRTLTRSNRGGSGMIFSTCICALHTAQRDTYLLQSHREVEQRGNSQQKRTDEKCMGVTQCSGEKVCCHTRSAMFTGLISPARLVQFGSGRALFRGLVQLYFHMLVSHGVGSVASYVLYGFDESNTENNNSSILKGIQICLRSYQIFAGAV